MNLKVFAISVCCTFTALLFSFAMADEIRLTQVESVFTAFGGDEVMIAQRITGGSSPTGTLYWSHMANDRTLDQGEVSVKNSEAASAVGKFTLRPPTVRDGVIFATSVVTEFVTEGSDEVTAKSTRPLTLFARAPLAERTNWARQLDIKLFDPQDTTAKAFEEMRLPFGRVASLAALSGARQHGILIVGEGVSLLKQRSLAASVLNAAASGRRVLMLAPAEGSLPFPGGDENFMPGELQFFQQHVIRRFDRRLDATAWPGCSNQIPLRRLVVEKPSWASRSDCFQRQHRLAMDGSKVSENQRCANRLWLSNNRTLEPRSHTEISTDTNPGIIGRRKLEPTLISSPPG